MGKRRPSRRTELAGILPAAQVDRSILVIRGQKVLLDEQLARFYGVETGRLMEQVKRNLARFPEDFMFRITSEEWTVLRSQIAISKSDLRGGRRYAPYAFTEQGVAMLSSVLRSKRAIEVNVQIMRAFVRLRQLLSVHKELAERLARLEEQMRRRDQSVDQQFRQIFALLDQLFNPPDPPRKPIGFTSEMERSPGDKK
jgi:hypothetical protein